MFANAVSDQTTVRRVLISGPAGPSGAESVYLAPAQYLVEERRVGYCLHPFPDLFAAEDFPTPPPCFKFSKVEIPVGRVRTCEPEQCLGSPPGNLPVGGRDRRLPDRLAELEFLGEVAAEELEAAESLERVGRVDLEDGDVGFGAVVLDGCVDEGGFLGGVGGALDLGCVRFLKLDAWRMRN